MKAAEFCQFAFCAGADRGFTLHETLIAMALISIGMLGLALNTSGVMRGNYRSDTLTAAANLAQDKIEEIKSRPKLAPADNCSVPAVGSEPAEAKVGPTGAAAGIYDRCWIVRDSDFGAGLKQIDVRVSWFDGEQRAVTLSTLIYGR
ncbi:MAG TPA: prepilin-type N-terminal cleavage/methylation domain-containing protein [Candidatus Acidoferrales bacterium]|nr:prepilin-type N-terminal cleavage/methylation domain-containing protein [Candidatus Acidoferrales bacterium]